MRNYIFIITSLLTINFFAQDIIDEKINFNTCEIYDYTNLTSTNSSFKEFVFRLFKGTGEISINWNVLEEKGQGYLIYKNDKEEGFAHFEFINIEHLNVGIKDTLTVVYSGIMVDNNTGLVTVVKVMIERTLNPFKEVFIIHSNFELVDDSEVVERQSKLIKVYY